VAAFFYRYQQYYLRLVILLQCLSEQVLVEGQPFIPDSRYLRQVWEMSGFLYEGQYGFRAGYWWEREMVRFRI